MLSERDIEEFRYLFELGHLQSMELGYVDERRRLAGLQLLAEVERLRAHEADARLGAAVRRMKEFDSINRFRNLSGGKRQYEVWHGATKAAAHCETLTEALAAAGLMEAEEADNAE